MSTPQTLRPTPLSPVPPPPQNPTPPHSLLPLRDRLCHQLVDLGPVLPADDDVKGLMVWGAAKGAVIGGHFGVTPAPPTLLCPTCAPHKHRWRLLTRKWYSSEHSPVPLFPTQTACTPKQAPHPQKKPHTPQKSPPAPHLPCPPPVATSRVMAELSLMMGLSICLPSGVGVMVRLWQRSTSRSSCRCSNTSRSSSSSTCTSGGGPQNPGRGGRGQRESGVPRYIPVVSPPRPPSLTHGLVPGDAPGQRPLVHQVPLGDVRVLGTAGSWGRGGGKSGGSWGEWVPPRLPQQPPPPHLELTQQRVHALLQVGEVQAPLVVLQLLPRGSGE